jgi:hypothetical protein
MARTPTGTITSVATAFSTAKTVTAITNAAEAVVSSTAHGLSNGDIVEITSGWGRLNKRAFRVKASTTDSFTLEGADTTNTDFYPPTGSAGSVRKATTWVQGDRTLNHGTTGGDPKEVTVSFIESDQEYVINDGFTAVKRTMSMDADMIGTPFYAALKQLTETQSDTIIQRRARTGAISLIPGKVALNEEETEDQGIAVVKIAINGNSRSTRYAS